MKKRIGVIIAVFLVLPVLLFAKIGVGIGTGKIVYPDPMKPGAIYTLPSIAVLNNGDETAIYGMSVSQLKDQPQIVPNYEWFAFGEDKFVLQPNEAKNISVKLSLPLKVKPGDYFCYLVAQPVQASTPGSATIGVAAAAKLYFTVMPSNVFQAVYYRVSTLIYRGAPWTYIVFGVIALAVLIKVLGQFISFDIGIKRKKR